MLYNLALEAHNAKKKPNLNKGLDLFSKPPASKFVKAANLGSAIGGLIKSLPSAPTAPPTQERAGSIAAALKKTGNVAMEIATSGKLLGNVMEALKRPEGKEADR